MVMATAAERAAAKRGTQEMRFGYPTGPIDTMAIRRKVFRILFRASPQGRWAIDQSTGPEGE